MRSYRLLGILPAAVTLTACSIHTPYAALEARGGYVETWRSATELEVRFHHNDTMTIEQALQLAMRRAAELTLEAGQPCFRTWGERLHEPKMYGPQYASVQIQIGAPCDEGHAAAEVVSSTEELARGRLSAKARAQLSGAEPDLLP